MIAREDKTPSLRDRLKRFCAAYARESGEGVTGERHGDAEAQPPPQEDEHGFPLPSTRPYPGLRAFTPRESRLFFGRLAEAADLRKRLADSNVVVVLGGSGSGKSSLVLAGILPRLNDVGRIPGRTGRWYTATFRPGDSPGQRILDAIWKDICEPLLALEQGSNVFEQCLNASSASRSIGDIRDRVNEIMAPHGRFTADGVTDFLERLDAIDARLTELRGGARSGPINLLLLADQFEELFREIVKQENSEDVVEIVKLLSAAKSHPKGPLVLVATLRSEELHRCTEIEGLAAIVNAGSYLVDRPGIKALITAAVNPGRQTLTEWGVKIADEPISAKTRELIETGHHAPFSIELLEHLKVWVEDFQRSDRSSLSEQGHRQRQQADLLPLFQHLLRISWGAAVARWRAEAPEVATVELSDIVNWVEQRRPVIEGLRTWMQKAAPVARPDAPHGLANMLEECFDTAFATTLCEAIAGKPWNEIDGWPADDARLTDRLRLVQAAFIALATRDDKGNEARRPASAEEILAVSSRTADAKALAALHSVLSFFKARNYIRGGENGERYDVSHEALIRNSTEYQSWLGEANQISEALRAVHSALQAAGEDALKKHMPRGWLSGTKSLGGRRLNVSWPGSVARFARRAGEHIDKLWRRFTLSDLRNAGLRLSEEKCIELSHIFGADAVFDPVWAVGRARIGATRAEHGHAAAAIGQMWMAAYRWHTDFAAEKRSRPEAKKLLGVSQLATWIRRSLPPVRAGLWLHWTNAPLPGSKEAAARKLLLWVLGATLIGVLGGGLIISASESNKLTNLNTTLTKLNTDLGASRDALKVTAVVGDTKTPRLDPANAVARDEIVRSGLKIQELGKKNPKGEALRDLRIATYSFDSAVRTYLNQSFLQDLGSTPATDNAAATERGCIRFDNGQAAPPFDRITSIDGQRQISFEAEENRLVPGFGDDRAELIRGETWNVLTGPTIVCGTPDLDYLLVWSQLSGVSQPVIIPVTWFSLGNRVYGRMQNPLEIRHIGSSSFSQKVTDVSRAISRSISQAKGFQVRATMEFSSHWVMMTVEVPRDTAFEGGSLAIHFARGIRSPHIVERPDGTDFKPCGKLPGDHPDGKGLSDCIVTDARLNQDFQVRVQSFAFDTSTPSGRGEAGNCAKEAWLCVHRVIVSHVPTPEEQQAKEAAVPRVESIDFYAPPITHAAIWHEYLVLRDRTEKYHSLPIELDWVSKIVEAAPVVPSPPPGIICRLFKCL